MITSDEVKQLVEQGIPGALVMVQDLTGTHDHYKVVVVTDDFDGKGLVKRHQMVNQALREPLEGPIHALSIEAYTKVQWQEKQKEKGPQGIRL